MSPRFLKGDRLFTILDSTTLKTGYLGILFTDLDEFMLISGYSILSPPFLFSSSVNEESKAFDVYFLARNTVCLLEPLDKLVTEPSLLNPPPSFVC